MISSVARRLPAAILSHLTARVGLLPRSSQPRRSNLDRRRCHGADHRGVTAAERAGGPASCGRSSEGIPSMPPRCAVGPFARGSHPRGVRGAWRGRRAAGRLGQPRPVLLRDLLPPAGHAVFRQAWRLAGNLLWVAVMLVAFWRSPAGPMWKLVLFLLAAGRDVGPRVPRSVADVDDDPVSQRPGRRSLRAPGARLPDRAAVEPVQPVFVGLGLPLRAHHPGRVAVLLGPGLP